MSAKAGFAFGGVAAGADTLFIASGIHSGDVLKDGVPDLSAVAHLADAAGARPDFVMDVLRW